MRCPMNMALLGLGLALIAPSFFVFNGANSLVLGAKLWRSLSRLHWQARKPAPQGVSHRKLARVVTPRIREGATHVFHQYTIRVRDRDTAVQKLTQRGIGVGVHYPIPIHHQPLYRQLGHDDRLPYTEAASREVLSLPVHPSLTQVELDQIVEAVASL